MVYRRFLVAVEYQGRQHGEAYSRDIERIERLRAAGWEVFQVTSALTDRPWELVDRVGQALRERGWDGTAAQAGR
jgi:very-short-patch-repair endonuclease